jgi:hypothetical protein
LWLALLLVVLGVGYTLAWMHLAGLVRERVETTLAALRQTGASADCSDREVHGFPLHFVLYCKSISYADPASAAVVAVASMHATADIYNPQRVRIALAAPAELQVPGTGPIVVHWRTMHGELFPPLGRDAAIEVSGEQFTAEQAQSEPLFNVASMHGSVRMAGADADLKGSFDGLQFGPSLPDLGDLPSLSGSTDVVVEGGANLAFKDARSFRGRSAEIRKLTLSPSDDASITVKGAASVDQEGRLDADLRVRLRNPREIAAALKLAFPDEAKDIDRGLALISALGNDPMVPVTIREGRVTVGFFPVGRIPPLP